MILCSCFALTSIVCTVHVVLVGNDNPKSWFGFVRQLSYLAQQTDWLFSVQESYGLPRLRIFVTRTVMRNLTTSMKNRKEGFGWIKWGLSSSMLICPPKLRRSDSQWVVVNMYLHNLSNKYPVIFDFARLKVSIYLTSVQYYQPRGYVTQKGCQKIRNQNTLRYLKR